MPFWNNCRLDEARRSRIGDNGRMTANSFRAGHVAVLGRPNVGKSTLINALVGAKVSITSDRPQTTRHRMLGIASFESGQLVLVDTPGLHVAQNRAMSRVLNRAARGAVEGVDAAMLVVESGKWDNEDTLAYETLHNAGVPVVLVVNKTDRAREKTDVLAFLTRASEGREFHSVHPISALKRKGLDALVDTLIALVPEQEALYSEDDITDRSMRFMAAEFVREQLMRQLGAELPYAAAVEIEQFEEDGAMFRIGAVILIERDSQKAIVIGNGGQRIREIGTKARIQMERTFGRKVFLQTWVRVKAGWSDDEAALRALGYQD